MQASTSILPPSEGALASTDLSQFLQPSFDASSYVSSLLSSVDVATAATSTSAGLNVPHSPTARKASLSASPLRTPTSNGDQTAKQRKREQDQEEVDLSLAISRLNLAIEELDRSISNEVTSNAPALLARTSGLAGMQSGLQDTRGGIDWLDAEVRNLRSKVHDPFVRLTQLQEELRHLDNAGELVARVSKVVGLARRLETQMEAVFSKKDKEKEKGEKGQAEADGEGEDAVVGQVHGRDLARAALLISEITTLLHSETSLQNDDQDVSLLDLALIQELLPVVETARRTVVDYMEDMVVRGLRDLSALMLASSLQVAFNLGTLPSLVKDLVNDLTEVVRERTAAAFDLDSLSRALNLRLPTSEPIATTYSTYRGSRRGGSSEATRAQEAKAWEDAVWGKLETLLVSEMGAVCSKVYLLEKVLKLKNDADTGVNFLTKSLEVLGEKPSNTFWLTLSQSLQTQVASSTSKSAWLMTTLCGGYTRFVRLVQEFLAKSSVYTDVAYTAAEQGAEAVVLMRSLGVVEKAYLEKCTQRIAEVLSSILSKRDETADGAIRAIINALDASRFDALLGRAVVDRCTALVTEFGMRMDAGVYTEATAVALDGEVPVVQSWNACLFRFAHVLANGVSELADEQDSTYATEKLALAHTTVVEAARAKIIQRILDAVEARVARAVGKMHSQLSSVGGKCAGAGAGGASAYIADVCDIIEYLRARLLPMYPAAVVGVLAQRVAKVVVERFLLHASVFGGFATGERAEDGWKLRLATDMTELKLALSQLVGDVKAGSSRMAEEWLPEEEEGGLFKGKEATETFGALKAFRRLLFFSLEEVENQVAGTEKSNDLPETVLVLHVLSRQPGVLDKLISATLPNANTKRSGSGSGGVKSDFVQTVLTSASSLYTHLSTLSSSLDARTQSILTSLSIPL